VLRVAADDGGFAAAITAALADPEAALTRAEARRLAAAHYARDAVAARLMAEIRAVTGR
jgi:hypothetical protein